MEKYFVYILFSKKDQKLYVGCTSNIEKRLERHNKGNIKATKHRKPLVLIHYEKFEDKEEAFNKERFLKSLWGARFKKQIKTKYLKQLI
ncbi:MAG: GIY-YIG nuclease family protein [Candidatus Pacebacteria bacterium]|nr:GIY-YIG nuclease family protein [Candidatus Paceibacterota bacterium]